MVCSKADSNNQISMNIGADDRASIKRKIDIITPEGKTLKLSIEENTEIWKVKNDCELLCGIPSDLQVIQLQGRVLGDDCTPSILEISDGCTFRMTVPQWWQKFISTCYKGDTQQVRKRIYVKMSQVSREERSFTAAFVAAATANHNLMFAAFAGRKINLNSKTKLSGRNLLHAAVSGGSTSCVANILMNGGNALLEAPDNAGETPVKMAKNLYGEEGDMVNFLNVYLELHRRETNNSDSSNCYWDNLEKNNHNSDVISGDNESNTDDEKISPSDENLITDLGDLHLAQDEASQTNFTETKFFADKSDQSLSSVGKINIEDYDAKTGNNSLVVSSNPAFTTDNSLTNNEILVNLSCSEQAGNAQTNDTGYYSSGNHSIGKDGTEILWNEALFKQKHASSTAPKQELNLDEQTRVNEAADAVNNLSMLSADHSSDRDSGSSQWPKPRRRAQLRFIEQKRKRSTTERPNLEQLMRMHSDSIDNESHEKTETEKCMNQGKDYEQKTESPEKDSRAVTAGDVMDVWQSQDNVPTGAISPIRDSSDICHSPKPLRRAQIRKKSIVEQRRRRSMAQRPNIEDLDTGDREVEGRDGFGRGDENTTNGMLRQETENDATKNLKRDLEDPTCGVVRQTSEDTDGENLKRKNSSVNIEEHAEGHRATKLLEDESPVSAKYVLRVWQDQAHDAEMAALSGDESDNGRSPRVLRRAFLRKQVFIEQRRRRSATERPNIMKLVRRNTKDGESAGKDWNGVASDDRPSLITNNSSGATVGQENVRLDNPVVMGGNDCSEKDKETREPLSQFQHTEQTKERIPIRRAQMCYNTGPMLGALPKDTRSNSWSSMSGDESEGSDHEKVVTETVAPISRFAKTQRRRRLPLLPDKGIKLPVIKIEDSAISRKAAAIKAPHSPLGRTRSGSTCSDDSVSSVELSSERAR